MAGLAMLTYTPSRMSFLNGLLSRAANERAFLVLAVGYPAEGVTVPAIGRKPPDEVVTWVE